MVSIPGYDISKELYNGSRTLVYRADRETDQKSVVIKLMKTVYPSFSELVQFRNQFTIAKKLNLPGIIQTYTRDVCDRFIIPEKLYGRRLKADEKRPAIEVITEYGKLPPVKCFLGQLKKSEVQFCNGDLDPA